jgi:hypothetical protein
MADGHERPVLNEFIDFLAENDDPQRVLAFRLSQERQARLDELLEKNRKGSLTDDDRYELDAFEHLEHVVRRIKAGVLREYRAIPDHPINFGYKCAWYSVSSANTQGVAQFIGLRDAGPCNWERGVHHAYEGDIFVTPSVRGWTFVAGCCVDPTRPIRTEELTDRARAEIAPRLDILSHEFGTATFFVTHRVVEGHIWAKSVRGSLVRGYGYIGESGITFWDEGEITGEERAVREARCALRNDSEFFPNEQSVMDMARAWGVCPNDLEVANSDIGLSLGVLGSVSDLLSPEYLKAIWRAGEWGASA